MELITSITMSTLELAELTGKEHKHIKDDCRKMFKELDLQESEFSAPLKMESGQTAQVYNLDKRLTEILVTGYSIKLRAAVIDRMHELEAKIAAPQELTILDYAKALIAQSDAHKVEKKFIQDKREATTMNRLAQLSTDEEIKKQIKESIENCKGFINPKVIADLGDFKSAQFVNKILCVLNLQVSITAVSVKTKVKGEWVTYKSRFKLTEEGKFYGSEYLNPINLRGIQISLRWSKAVIDLIDEYLEQ